MRFVRTAGLAAALAVFLAGCAGIRNEPVNLPISGNLADALGVGRETSTYADDLMVGLAFSGGGTRAAAFSLGVLAEIERTRVTTRGGAMSLLDRVDFVSGVSGGSVLAAYYGLKQRQALADFRERFLLRDAEESLNTDVSPLSVVRALSGGVNDSSQFPRWLDKNLFEGATFREFRHNRRPRIWINASDIYNRTTVRVRRDRLRRAVQRPVVLSDRGCGRGIGRGADGVRAGGHQVVPRGNAASACRSGSRAPVTIRMRRRCCAVSPMRSAAITTAR